MKKRGSASARKTVSMTPGQVASKLASQRQARIERQQRHKAEIARDTYKPRKQDRGKLLMIGTQGQKRPQDKGRRGYLVYVTKTGKKWLVKQRGVKEPYRARTLRDIEAPATRNLGRAAKQFQRSRRVFVSHHRAAVKGRGELTPGKKSGGNDFNDKVVSKLAKGIKKTIDAQASHRSFLVSAMVLIQLPDGSTHVVNVEVPIDKPDHIAIRLAGIQNFVRQKFYAFMARELAYLGYVTSGSANHIRRLKANQGKPRNKWVDGRGDAWQGRKSDTVKIINIEWRMEQIK